MPESLYKMMHNHPYDGQATHTHRVNILSFKIRKLGVWVVQLKNFPEPHYSQYGGLGLANVE